MNDDFKALAATTLPASEMAATIGLKPRRLQQLAEAGLIPPSNGGQYDFVGTVQGYLSYLQDDERRSTNVVSANRLSDVRAQEIEERVQRRKEVMKADALKACMALVDEAAGGLKADLLSIPARVTKDLPLRRRIEDEITAALNAGSKRASAAARGQR